MSTARVVEILKRAKRRDTIATLRKAILSAASLLQDDPDLSEDTLEFLEADIRCAAQKFDELEDLK
jgi:hypothetical protein